MYHLNKSNHIRQDATPKVTYFNSRNNDNKLITNTTMSHLNKPNHIRQDATLETVNNEDEEIQRLQQHMQEEAQYYYSTKRATQRESNGFNFMESQTEKEQKHYARVLQEVIEKHRLNQHVKSQMAYAHRVAKRQLALEQRELKEQTMNKIELPPQKDHMLRKLKNFRPLPVAIEFTRPPKVKVDFSKPIVHDVEKQHALKAMNYTNQEAQGTRWIGKRATLNAKGKAQGDGVKYRSNPLPPVPTISEFLEHATDADKELVEKVLAVVNSVSHEVLHNNLLYAAKIAYACQKSDIPKNFDRLIEHADKRFKGPLITLYTRLLRYFAIRVEQKYDARELEMSEVAYALEKTQVNDREFDEWLEEDEDDSSPHIHNNVNSEKSVTFENFLKDKPQAQMFTLNVPGLDATMSRLATDVEKLTKESTNIVDQITQEMPAVHNIIQTTNSILQDKIPKITDDLTNVTSQANDIIPMIRDQLETIPTLTHKLEELMNRTTHLVVQAASHPLLQQDGSSITAKFIGIARRIVTSTTPMTSTIVEILSIIIGDNLTLESLAVLLAALETKMREPSAIIQSLGDLTRTLSLINTIFQFYRNIKNLTFEFVLSIVPRAFKQVVNYFWPETMALEDDDVYDTFTNIKDVVDANELDSRKITTLSKDVYHKMLHDIVRSEKKLFNEDPQRNSVMINSIRILKSKLLMYYNAYDMYKDHVDRITPAAILLCGDSRVGKSMIATYIAKAIQEALLEHPNQDVKKLYSANGNVYSKNATSCFYDGYKGQGVLICDEIGSKTDGSDIADLLTMISSNVFLPPMASIDSTSPVGMKGTPFTSHTVICCSNMPTFEALNSTYFNTDAINARFPFRLEMHWKDKNLKRATPTYDYVRVAFWYKDTCVCTNERMNIRELIATLIFGSRGILRYFERETELRSVGMNHLCDIRITDMPQTQMFFNKPDFAGATRESTRMDNMHIYYDTNCADCSFIRSVPHRLATHRGNGMCRMDTTTQYRLRYQNIMGVCAVCNVSANHHLPGMEWLHTYADYVDWKEKRDIELTFTDKIVLRFEKFIARWNSPVLSVVAKIACALLGLGATAAIVCGIYKLYNHTTNKPAVESHTEKLKNIPKPTRYTSAHTTPRLLAQGLLHDTYEQYNNTAAELNPAYAQYNENHVTRANWLVKRVGTIFVGSIVNDKVEYKIEMCCVPLCDTIIMTNYHLIHEACLTYPKDKIVFGVAFANGDATLHYKLGDIQVVTIEDCDVALLRLVKCPRFPSLLRYFVSEKDLNTNILYQASLVGLDKDGDDYYPFIKSTDSVTLQDSEFAYHGTVRYAIRRHWTYQMPTIQGNCGSPLIISGGGIQGRLAGIHAYGQKNGVNGAVVITRENVLYWLKQFPDLVICNEFEPISNIYHGSMSVAQVQAKIYTSRKCDLYRNPDFADLPTTRYPAILKTTQGVDPIYEAIKKNNIPDGTGLDDKYYQMALEKIIYDYKEIGRCKLLDDEQVLVGNERLERINPTTSPGYPYVLYGRRKKDYVEFDESGEVVVHNSLPFDLAKLLEKMLHENVVHDFLYVTCPKSELREEHKVKLPRVFEVLPLHGTLVIRKMFGSLVARIVALHNSHSIKVGINPESPEWAYLYHRINRVNHEVIAADWKKFDGSIPVVVFQYFAKFANEFYQDEYASIRERIMTLLYRRTCWFDQTMYSCEKGNPSGNPLTSTFNSFAFLFLLHCYLGRKFEEKALYTMKYECAIYGDDGIIAHEDPTVNLADIQAFMQTHFNMNITSDTKDDSCTNKPLSEVRFLKRKFATDSCGCIIPQIHVSSMFCLLYLRRSNAVSEECIKKASLASLLEFLYFYGKDHYDEVTSFLTSRGYKCPSYNFYYRKFHSLEPVKHDATYTSCYF